MKRLIAIVSQGAGACTAWIESLPEVYAEGAGAPEAKNNLLKALDTFVQKNNVPTWLMNKQYQIVFRYLPGKKRPDIVFNRRSIALN